MLNVFGLRLMKFHALRFKRFKEESLLLCPMRAPIARLVDAAGFFDLGKPRLDFHSSTPRSSSASIFNSRENISITAS
jgi:hypothetical protein